MNIKLIIIKNRTAFDVSELISQIQWSGRKGSPARSLRVTFIDDDARQRVGIDVEQGHQCIFSVGSQELFRGMFMRQEQVSGKRLTVTAYDNGIYLANNKDTFNYTNETASEIFRNCCNRFGIPVGDIANTGYRIPELPKPGTTAWDVITDALGLTFEATGVRYYPVCIGERLSLIERRRSVRQWVVETGVNLEGYTLSKSIENVKTRIRLLSSEGDVLAEAINSDLERRIGIFQNIKRINDEMNSAQLTELVNSRLAENNKATQSLVISALGLTEIISGIGVFINIKPVGVSQTYYVDSDTHIFKGNMHTMTLKLVTANDMWG